MMQQSLSGIMHKHSTHLLAILCFAVFVAACSNGGGNEGSKPSIDEQERAVDWTSQLRLELELSDTVSEFNEVSIVSHQSSQSLDRFVEQVFDMAFSGDAQVFAPTLFGDIDRTKPMNPKALVDELERFDTVVVEDILTGGLKDTVVDMTFSKKDISALTLHVGIAPESDLVLHYDHLAVGKQVFHSQTGEFRGISDKFFLANGAGPLDLQQGYIDNLLLFSDSVGAFYPHAFSIHRDLSDRTLGDWLRERFPAESRFEMILNLGLDSQHGKVILEAVSIKPIGAQDPA